MAFFFAQQAPPMMPPLPHPEQFEAPVIVPPPPWWYFAGGVLLVCLLLSLIIWLLFRARKAETAAAGPRPWNRAMDALHDLRARLGQQSHVETAHQVSEVLRRYFWERYEIPAPFRTRRELFEQEAPKASQRVGRYAPLAAMWDELSFAPIPITQEEARALVDRAIVHLEEDRP
jgi:hypothetical protein